MLPVKDPKAKTGVALKGLKEGAALPDAFMSLVQTQDQGHFAPIPAPKTLPQLDRKLSPQAKARQQKAVRSLQSGLKDLSRKDYAAAKAKIQKAVELDKDNVLAWRMLAFTLEQQEHYAKAFDAYEAAVRLAPDDITLLRDVGLMAYRLDRLALAEKLFVTYLTREPDDEEVLTNLACTWRDQNRYGDAVDLLREAIGRHPERASLWNALGTVLYDSGDAAGSLVFYEEAIRLAPQFYQAFFNRGQALYATGEIDRAIEDLDYSGKRMKDPKDVASALLAKAFAKLQNGDLVGGFADYEARFIWSADGRIQFAEHGKRWAPEDDLTGKTVLLYGEQGLGDEIMFASLVQETLEAIGPQGRLYMAVEPRLVPLFQRSFPSAVVLAYRLMRGFNIVSKSVDLGSPEPQIDLWAPAGSLFRRFRTRLEDFPDRTRFLEPDPERVAHWRQQLAASGPGPYVGVLWKSMNNQGARQRHYSPFDLWEPVFKTPGLRFVNIQYGDASEDLANAKARGFDIWTPPGIDLKQDIDDLAALSAALDLVIGPATANTNIAASMGTRVWIPAGPGWWTGFGTDHLPCYPSTRVFHGRGYEHWDEVMQQLADALQVELQTGGFTAQDAS